MGYANHKIKNDIIDANIDAIMVIKQIHKIYLMSLMHVQQSILFDFFSALKLANYSALIYSNLLLMFL